MKRILIVLLLCSSVWAQNDFSADADCVALWSFENGALTTDSIGSNTLTAQSTPAADLTNFKEKSASVELIQADGDYFTIADASLDAGFPGKSGDGGDKWSVTFWFRMQGDWVGAGAIEHYVLTKNAAFQNSFGAGYLYSAAANEGSFRCYIGHNSGNSIETFDHATTITLAAHTNNWYHVGATFDDSDKSFRIRVYDNNASAILGSDATGNTTNNWAPREAAKIIIGAQTSEFSNVDHNIDELTVWKKVLTADEIDEIRQGIFGAAGGAGLMIISKALEWEMKTFLNDFVNGRWKS